MIGVLAVAVALGIVLPHVARLDGARPATAVALWAVSLGLRAVTGVLAAIVIVLFLPASGAFDELTHWCWHAIVPLVATHLGLAGHSFGGAVVIFPAVLLGGSLASIVFGLVRAGRAVRQLLQRDAIGAGPDGAVIVGGSEVMLAAAGFARPKVVVSAGALIHLDDAELGAALAHERGHIVRRHRWVVVYGELCRGLGRFVPGATAARDQLVFHLERDADSWATRRHDPLALASAICKAGLSRPGGPSSGYAGLVGARGAARRIDELLNAVQAERRPQGRLLSGAALTGAVLLVGLTLAVPLTVAEGHSKRDTVVLTTHCRA